MATMAYGESKFGTFKIRTTNLFSVCQYFSNIFGWIGHFSGESLKVILSNEPKLWPSA